MCCLPQLYPQHVPSSCPPFILFPLFHLGQKKNMASIIKSRLGSSALIVFVGPKLQRGLVWTRCFAKGRMRFQIQSHIPYPLGAELPGRTSSLPGSVAVDGLLSSEIMPPFHLQLILWNNSLLSTLSYSLQGTISKQDNFLFSSLAWKKSYKKMVFSAILIKAIILEFVLSIWEPFGCQGQFPNISSWIGVLVFPTYQIFSSQLDIFNSDVFLKLFGDN